MGLAVLRAAHVRVVCDRCRSASAEVCGHRDLPVMAIVAAVRKFKAVGWHHDPGRMAPPDVAPAGMELDGSGRWYCPACGRIGHL